MPAAVKAPVLCVPLAGLLPLHAPDAVHAVALVELQVSVSEAPSAIVAAPADSFTVGDGITVTVVCEAALFPAAPVQTSA